ncbi:hypothetical protein PENTCL1PPCAC_28310, partial [Pristionchus entomophagus]
QMRLWVFLLALFALSATILAQDFEGEEESTISDSDGASIDNLEEVPEADLEDEEVNAAGEEIESPVGASEAEDDVTPVEENEEPQLDSEIPEDADEAHVADSESDGATEEQLLANENVGEETTIDEAQAQELQSEGDWGVDGQDNGTKPEWKTYPLYSGIINVDRDCGCKIKWMKKVYLRPKPRPKFYHFHKSVGFHTHHHPGCGCNIGKKHHHHHCKRVKPFPRRAHVHHVIRHHVHHKKPCACLKKTVVKNVIVHHPRPRKPCHVKHGHHHGHGKQWRFGRANRHY